MKKEKLEISNPLSRGGESNCVEGELGKDGREGVEEREVVEEEGDPPEDWSLEASSCSFNCFWITSA